MESELKIKLDEETLKFVRALINLRIADCKNLYTEYENSGDIWEAERYDYEGCALQGFRCTLDKLIKMQEA